MKYAHLKNGSRLFSGYLKSYLCERLHILGSLQRLVISVTGRCNSRCLTCSIWQNRPDKNEEISIKDFETLKKSKQFKNLCSIVVTGGEPFLREDIKDILEVLLDNTKATLAIITNGLLPDKIYKTVRHIKGRGLNIDKISLSLNGKEDTHDKTRGVKGSYLKVIDTIKILNYLKVHTSLVFTITMENYDQIEWAYELSRKLDVDINFYPEISSYRFGEDVNERTFNEMQKKEILRQLKNVYQKRSYYYFDDSNLYFINKMLQHEQVCRCYAGLQSVFINQLGDVYPCEGFNNDLSFGNIKNQCLDDIWKTKRADSIRNFIAKGKCQPCFLACDIVPSLRNEIFSVLKFTLKNRLLNFK